MILPVDFLWHQLNGPQARAIEQAIYDYWKQMFDDRLEYLNQLTIDNANDSHLNLFGVIANFVRPVIQVPDKDYFLFTEHDEHDNEKGLAAVNNRAVGGRLTSLKGASTGAHALDTEFYRTLLQTYRDSEGELDSFILLDDICNALSLKDKPDETPAYEFSIVDTVDPGSGRGPGDVYIDIGSLTDWANPFQIYAVINGLANSVFYPLPRIWTSLDTDVRCHTPTPDVIGGTYGESVTVELSCTTPGSVIYYTLDGTEPTQEEGIPYTAPLVIDQTTQLKARAWAAEKEPSFVYSTTYIIQTGVQLPQVMSTLATGTYTEDQLVTLNCPFGLPVSIRYTLDDSEPTLSSPEYTEPFMTTGNMKLKAKAFRGAYEPSETLVVNARIMLPAVVIGPDIWTGSPTVTLTCAMAGVTILYSTDGDIPRDEYTTPFVLNNDTTVKAIAIREGYTASVVSEKYFEINQVPPVEASMPSGSYIGEQTVTLSCPMSNVQIRYTLDGSDPTEASTDYVEGTSITIPNRATTILKAKAWKGALSPSEISTWTYTCRNAIVPMYAIMYDKDDFESPDMHTFPTYVYESYDGITWTKRPTPAQSTQSSYIGYNRINNIIQVLVNGAIETYVDEGDSQYPYFYHVGNMADLSTWTGISITPYTAGKGALKLCPKGSSTDKIIWSAYWVWSASGKGTYLKGNNTTEVITSDYAGSITALRNGTNLRAWGYDYGSGTVATSDDLSTFTSVSRNQPYWSLYVPELDKFFVNGGGNVAYWDDSTSAFVNISGLEWGMAPFDRMIYIPGKQKLVYIAVVSKRIFIKESVDGGTTWTTVSAINVPELDSTEGLVAVSYNAYIDRIVVLCNDKPHWGTAAPQYNHTLLIAESNGTYSYEIYELDSSLAIWSDVGYASDPLSTVPYDDNDYN